MGWIGRIPGHGDVHVCPRAWGWGQLGQGGRAPLKFWLLGSHHAPSKGPGDVPRGARKRGSRGDLVLLLLMPALENCGVLHARLDSGPASFLHRSYNYPFKIQSPRDGLYMGAPTLAPRDISALSIWRTGEQLPNPPGFAARISVPGHPIAVVAPYRMWDAILRVGFSLKCPPCSKWVIAFPAAVPTAWRPHAGISTKQSTIRSFSTPPAWRN